MTFGVNFLTFYFSQVIFQTNKLECLSLAGQLFLYNSWGILGTQVGSCLTPKYKTRLTRLTRLKKLTRVKHSSLFFSGLSLTKKKVFLTLAQLGMSGSAMGFILALNQVMSLLAR
jgi:hypothetical protein